MSAAIDDISAVAAWCERQIDHGRPEAAIRMGHDCIKRNGYRAEEALRSILDRADFEEDRILAYKIRKQYGPK